MAPALTTDSMPAGRAELGLKRQPGAEGVVEDPRSLLACRTGIVEEVFDPSKGTVDGDPLPAESVCPVDHSGNRSGHLVDHLADSCGGPSRLDSEWPVGAGQVQSGVAGPGRSFSHAVPASLALKVLEGVSAQDVPGRARVTDATWCDIERDELG